MKPRTVQRSFATLVVACLLHPVTAVAQDAEWTAKVQAELLELMPPREARAAAPAQRRVLVTLKPTPGMTPRSAGYRTAQGIRDIQASVQTLQETVLSRPLAGSYRDVHRYQSLFGFSALVDDDAIEAMASQPEVERIELRPVYKKAFAESHPLTHVDQLHTMGFTGQGVTIAIIDDGIDHDHPAFGGFTDFPNAKILGGRDFADDDDDPTIDCLDQSHGTGVAGVAAGDGGGVTGTAPDATLVFLKVQSALICGSPSLDGDIVGAIDWAVTQRDTFGIRVLSMSLGAGGFPTVAGCESSSLATRNAINAATAAGLVVLAASGNDGFCDRISRPACVGNAISVGAVYDDRLGSPGFCVSPTSCVSQFHPVCATDGLEACFDTNNDADAVTCYSNSSELIDILAPANCAFTAATGGGTRDCFGGTSSATPFAAGVAASLIEASGTLDNDGMRTLLGGTGVLTTDGKNNLARPRIDATAALAGLGAPPAVTITAPADGATFAAGDPLVFAATATDAEDGDVSAALSWASDLDGAIGTGASFSNAGLSIGTHTITASVTDSDGRAGEDSVSVTLAATATGAIDWNATANVAYSDQDRDGSVTVEDGGATLALVGNRWRRTAETFTLTPFTTLEFDFQSTSQGEIQGIGFDRDDDIFNAPRVFQLFGIQDWSGGIHAYDGDYSAGATMTYRIPVGAFYTGSDFRLVLVNDKDVGSLDNTARFSNVRVFENLPSAAPLDFGTLATEAYSNQDRIGSFATEDSGATLFLEGNRWRRSTQPFTISPTTLVAFEFQSTSRGEIHGLGFDENQELSDEERIFKLFGTQNWTGDIDWLREYETGEIGTFKTYVIPVGRFYSGSGFRLVLVNDQDDGAGDNTSRFRNVRIYELD